MLRAERKLLVVHAAARIALDDPIQAGAQPHTEPYVHHSQLPLHARQTTLRANYEGTKNLLKLVRSLAGLAGFVHVSTAFVNACKPFTVGSTQRHLTHPVGHEHDFAITRFQF